VSAKALLSFLETESGHLDQAGLLRRELALEAPAGPTLMLGGKEVLNLASGDYLGLSGNAELKRAVKQAIDGWGVGLTSPRAVTGTLRAHQELEKALATYLGAEEALVFPSGYHANTGTFESLFSDRDFVFCDEQVHPSLADGLRLCRARIYSYRNQDLEHLEDRLKRSRAARFRAIVTDGFFSTVGETAKLAEIYALADRYEAVVFVDDSEGVGVLGAKGRGTHEALGLEKRLDMVTGSLGTAFGVAGGYAAGRKQIIGWLRQKSRPYLAASALAPGFAAGAARALQLVQENSMARDALRENARTLRTALGEQGLQLVAGEHPAISVMIGNAVTAQRMTDLLLKKGVYVTGFCYPVVPEGAARVRAQVTARHPAKALKNAAVAFGEAWKDVSHTTRPR
jgi:glycine C-acetyltransferase